MRRIFIAFLLSIITLSGYGQNNVNVDNYRFTYTYRDLPKTLLNPPFFYYGTHINMPAAMQQFIDIDALYEGLFIEAQRFTDTPEADDVMVEINMGMVNIESSDIKEHVSEKKDKQGNIKKSYSYTIVVAYSFDSNAVVTKGNKKLTAFILDSRNKPHVFQSDFFKSSREASQYLRNNRENFRERFARELTLQVVASASQTLSNTYGFPVRQTTDIIKTINEKKHPENNAFRAASDKLKAALERTNADSPLQEEDVADLIEYYKNIPVRYTDPKLKADVRLRYAAYYNLCKIYLHLEQLENVQPYANLILENGHDKKDCERMNNEAQKLAERFNSSGIRTRHFNPNNFFED